MMNSMMKALASAMVKAIKVGGKEISKKTIYIAGGVAGTAALAGGTTAVVIHKKKKKKANEEATEDTQQAESSEKTADEADQAPVEEAGAEKVDAEVSNSEPTAATPAENAAANNATQPKDNVVDVSKVIEKKVETPTAPVEEKKVDEIKHTVATQPTMGYFNPEPNPVFKMLQPGMMQPMQDVPFGMAPMSFPPFGMNQPIQPVAPAEQPSFQGSVSENNTMEQPNNQVINPVVQEDPTTTEENKGAENKEVNGEKTTVTPLPEDPKPVAEEPEEAPVVEEEETVVWTPADAVNGTAGKQNGKTKRTKIQKPALELPNGGGHKKKKRK